MHRNNNNWTHFKFGMSRFSVPYFIILKKNNTAAIICSNSASEQCFTNSKLWQNFQMWKRKLVSIHKRLCAIFGRCAVSRSLIAELRELLLSGETKLYDLPYSESLPTATNPDSTEIVFHMNSQITSQQLALRLSESKVNAVEIITARAFKALQKMSSSKSLTCCPGTPF